MRLDERHLLEATTDTRCLRKGVLCAVGGLLVCICALKLTSIQTEIVRAAPLVGAVDMSARNHPLKSAVPPSDNASFFWPPLKKVVPLSDNASFFWPSHILEPPQREATERKGMMTPSISPRDVVAHYYASGGKLSGHIVNVGAGDGCIEYYHRECDEANEFFEMAIPTRYPVPMSDVRSRTRAIDNKFKGHLYEPNKQEAAILSATYKHISIGGRVDASNFARILQSDGVPRKIDFLSMIPMLKTVIPSWP